MLHQLLVCTLFVVSAGEVEVRPLAGPPVKGELVELSDGQLVLSSGGTEQKLAVDSLLHVRPAEPVEADVKPATVWLKLSGGSMLNATSFTVEDRVAAVTLNTGEEVSIAARAIDWVRFQEQSEELTAEWNAIVAKEVAGDRLVVRRSVEREDPDNGQKRTEESLDFLSGVLSDVTADTLNFELNDRKLEVGRRKAEGLIYHRVAGRQLPSPVCIVRAAGGNVWQAKSVALTGGGWELVSVSGVKHTLPLGMAELLDYSAGKVVYLSDLEPETSDWHSFFGGKNELASLKQLFAPRRDRNLDGKPLSVGGVQYDRGLALHSHSNLVFRLPGEFRKLSAVAGIDDSLGDNGHVVLRIYGDKNLLLEKEVAGADAEPLMIDLDVEGVRRLRIEVGFGENLDIADHLNLCDIKVMK